MQREGQPVKVATLAAPGVQMFLLSKAGTVAAAVCGDQKLRIWTLPKGKLTQTIDLGKRSLDVVVISDDGASIAAGDHEGQYTVWNVSTSGQLMQFQLPYYPFALAFSPDGKRLAVAPAGEPVQIYEVASKKKLFSLQRVTGGTASITFSRDGQRIGTADTDTVVRVYDGRNGELLARHTDFLLVPLAAAFTVDGKQLIAGGGDKVVTSIDITTGKAVRKSAKLVDPVAYLEVSVDGTLTATGLMHADNMLMPAPVLISETGSGKKVQEWMPPSRVLGGSWTRDGHLMAALGGKNDLQLWRVR